MALFKFIFLIFKHEIASGSPFLPATPSSNECSSTINDTIYIFLFIFFFFAIRSERMNIDEFFFFCKLGMNE